MTIFSSVLVSGGSASSWNLCVLMGLRTMASLKFLECPISALWVKCLGSWQISPFSSFPYIASRRHSFRAEIFVLSSSFSSFAAVVRRSLLAFCWFWCTICWTNASRFGSAAAIAGGGRCGCSVGNVDLDRSTPHVRAAAVTGAMMCYKGTYGFSSFCPWAIMHPNKKVWAFDGTEWLSTFSVKSLSRIITASRSFSKSS